MTELSTDLDRASDGWTLKLIGSVDATTSHLMWSVDSSASLLNEIREANIQSLKIDLIDTKAIDSHALRLLLNAHKEFATQNIPITLCNPNSHLSRLFRIMQFDRVFDIEERS
ncbi:MAG: STAS domain-containing protein [Chloroflexota bacterium]